MFFGCSDIDRSHTSVLLSLPCFCFIQGAHVTINARTEDDVEEDVILKKVASSSGSNYSFHKEKPKAADNAPAGPVGSVYKRTNAAAEIKAKRSDDFWNKHDVGYIYPLTHH